MLRPLGTIVTQYYEPSICCTDTSATVVNRRVIDYVKALNPNTGRVELMEQLEAVSVKSVHPKSSMDISSYRKLR
jgi:hypothetical protein